MIILYTFDYYKTRLISAYYLVVSICSVVHHFRDKPYRIIIYTTNVIELTNYLKNLLKSIKIDIRCYNPSQFQKNYYSIDWSRYPPKWNIIGHSRIFLIPYLLDQYRESLLYLDCDTGVVLDQRHLYDNLTEIIQPFMNTKEIELKTDIYGESQTFCQQLLDIKILYHKVITTPTRVLYNKEITGQSYCVTKPTRNNGILYFPYNDQSLVIACEIMLVYDRLMEIYPYGFNDLNAASCVFEHHTDLQCSTMIPYRVLLNKDVMTHVDCHINYTPIDLTHYFTTSWVYHGQQADPIPFERIISVYQDTMLQLFEKPKIKNQLSSQIKMITGDPPDPCENILETIIFPKLIIGMFHPIPGVRSFVSIVRHQINRFLRIKSNSILLSYITFILVCQHNIWNKLLYHQPVYPQDWFDPTEQQIDINECGSEINHEIKSLTHGFKGLSNGPNGPNGPSEPFVESILRAIKELSQLDSVKIFLKICQDKYPKNMLLSVDSVNYCPPNGVILKNIQDNNISFITKYLPQLDPNQLDETGHNWIHHCVIHNRVEIMQLFLSQRTIDKSCINTLTTDGQTPCHLAVKNIALEPLILLLRSNADCSIKNTEGQTPRMLATDLQLGQFCQVLTSYDYKIQHRNRRHRP
jgi:hypothetical protein